MFSARLLWFLLLLFGLTAQSPQSVPQAAFPKAPRKERFVRTEIQLWTDKQVASLRKGVAAMKARPKEDPTSWLYQANLYATKDQPALAGWNSGQQGNYFFLAWNRMQLYWLERMLRKSSGDPNFCLPYWNFSAAAQRAVPEPYRAPKPNPLFCSERAPGVNQGLCLPQPLVTYAAAFRFLNFYGPQGSALTFGGQRVAMPSGLDWPHSQLESRTADALHILLGGEKGWMSQPEFAARDPLFYLVRANLDRLWKRWEDDGAGRKNPSLGETAWARTKFLFFDENGKQVEMSGAEIMDSVSQLDYGYDDDSAFIPLSPGSKIALKELPEGKYDPVLTELAASGPLRLLAEPVSLSIALDETSRVTMNRQIGPVDQQGLLTLHFEGIQFEKQPGIVWEMYLNLPADQEPIGQTPYFLGGMAFYATPQENGKPKDFELVMEITQCVRTQKKRREWDESKMELRFVPRAVHMKKRKSKTPSCSIKAVRFILEK